MLPGKSEIVLAVQFNLDGISALLEWDFEAIASRAECESLVKLIIQMQVNFLGHNPSPVGEFQGEHCSDIADPIEDFDSTLLSRPAVYVDVVRHPLIVAV